MLCSIPFIAMILLFILIVITNNDLNLEQKDFTFEFVAIYNIVLFLIGIILISIYVYSYKKYNKMISLFSEEELERINKEAKISYNMGELLITNDVVIFFSFFSKKVIPTKTIKCVEKEEGTYTGNRGGSIDYHNIILKCENDKNVRINAPKNYNNTECENCKKIIGYIIKNRRFNKKEYININSLKEAQVFKNYKEFSLSRIMDIIIAIPYILICLIINRVIKVNIANGSDFVLRIFYSVGIEDFLICIEIVIYTIIFLMINVHIKFNNEYEVKGNTGTKGSKSIVFIMLIFFIWLFIATDYDYKKETRSDYVNYLKNECETYTSKFSYYKGVDYKEVSWASYYHGKKNYLFANDKVFVYTGVSIDENKIYKITYLPKTHLIVNINEETH